MDRPTLVIGNKNYSSWSLRAWLALKRTGAAFEEIMVPLDRPETRAAIRAHSPTGRVPVLEDGERTIWDSLAIAEYLAERFPDVGLWPADEEDRALARSVCAEMHAGFAALRSRMPMNLRARYPGQRRSPEVDADIARIQEIWEDCRHRVGENGPFLFGAFTLADAFYAPVVSRFRTYDVAMGGVCRAYAEAVWAWPDLQSWAAAAAEEPHVIEAYTIAEEEG
jgi:glutathione S-transferase